MGERPPATVVLDDDPTGTQAVSGVTVLYRWTASDVIDVLRSERAVFLQTNSRALDHGAAVRLAEKIRGQIVEAEAALGERVLVVQRGDSTLRGHVFAELDVFMPDADALLFVPAFPGIGRRTVGGVHTVDIAGVPTPVGMTEFAAEPVFGYRSSSLVDFVREKGDRTAVRIPLTDLRRSRGAAVSEALTNGALIVSDAETEEDIALIHSGLSMAVESGRRVLVRCAASLAALCAGRLSTGTITAPLAERAGPVLIVCGSHTSGARAQLEVLTAQTGVYPVEIVTDLALEDPSRAAKAAIELARAALREGGIAAITTERTRRTEHDSLATGSVVMSALMEVVRALLDETGIIISKGGITSAEVAGALGASRARVRGQLFPGVSVLDLAARSGARTQIVVPGNVGDAQTLVDCLRAASWPHGAAV